jgi:hypothetical protein
LQPAVFGTDAFDGAEAALESAVKRMCLKLKLPAQVAEYLQTIKATMNRSVGRHGLTVLQMLCLEPTKNQPELVPEFFQNEIGDFLTRNYQTPRRKARQIARNAWKEDPGADCRVRAALVSARAPVSANEILSAHRGRPDLYEPLVVWAFADSIAEATGRKFSVGRHGDKTITDERMAGPMLAVLVAAVRWAMAMRSPGITPPLVKTEGILTLIKRGRPTD